MRDRPPSCHAYQASDQVMCPHCGLVWDVNDPDPPPCRPTAGRRQEGGTHYVDMAIQPVEFGMKNHWDFCACSILKYLARHRRKNGLSDVRKARHFVELRMQYGLYVLLPRHSGTTIPMESFISANGFDGADADAEALMRLADWVECRKPEMPLVSAIEGIMREYEGDQAALPLGPP